MIGELHIISVLEAGDLESIVHYHDAYYAENYGLNHDFGRYVDGPLTEFYNRKSPGERIWLLKNECGIKGCIALTRITEVEAQLRWFYVDESLRSQGWGQKLIDLLISFAEERHYCRIILWTVSLLLEARHLYEKNGFILEEEHESLIWGKELVEQKFTKVL